MAELKRKTIKPRIPSDNAPVTETKKANNKPKDEGNKNAG